MDLQVGYGSVVGIGHQLGNRYIGIVFQIADDDVGKWFMGLLDGSGTGPSQIIVTAVLGCVPVVGQLFDLRDLIRGIILVSANPANVMGWVDLVITLIGCIPGFGDAFKAGFKLAKNGANAERVFDAMRKYAKIDPKKALKEINWNKLKNECISLLNKMIDEIVDVLDSWLAKQVIGRPKVNEVIKMFTQVKKDAPKYMNAAFAEIQKTVNQMLNMHPPLPSTAVGKASQQVPARPVVPRGGGKGATPPPTQRPSNPQFRGGRGDAQARNASKNPASLPAHSVTARTVRPGFGALTRTSVRTRPITWASWPAPDGMRICFSEACTAADSSIASRPTAAASS